MRVPTLSLQDYSEVCSTIASDIKDGNKVSMLLSLASLSTAWDDAMPSSEPEAGHFCEDAVPESAPDLKLHRFARLPHQNPFLWMI